MSIINDLTITSLETIKGYDVLTGEWKFTLDELQNAKITNSQEKTDITGKGGRKLNSIKKNKAVTISGSNGLISAGMIEAEVGGAFTSGVQDVMWTDYLVVNSNEAETSYKAAGTTGNEIGKVYVKNSDNTLGKSFEQSAATSAGKFTYTPATNKLIFNTGELADGTEIIVHYIRKVEATKLSNISDKYSEKLTLYIDAIAEDKCNNVYYVQFYVPTADFSGNFEIEMGENQSVQNFEAESVTSTCHGTSKFWDMIIFGEDAVDA